MKTVASEQNQEILTVFTIVEDRGGKATLRSILDNVGDKLLALLMKRKAPLVTDGVGGGNLNADPSV